MTNTTWWRWPLMPVAALAGGILGSIAFSCVGWLSMKISGGYSEDGWYYRFINPTLSWGIFGYVAASIAYWVSPLGKTVAAVIMCTVISVLLVLMTAYTWLLMNADLSLKIEVSVGTAASVLGCVLGVIHCREQHPER